MPRSVLDIRVFSTLAPRRHPTEVEVPLRHVRKTMILEHHSSGGQMRMPRQNVKGRGLAIQIIHAGGIDKAFDTSGRVEL